MTSTLSPPLPPNNAPPGMPLALAASPHASHLRPALNPSPPSALSLTPIHSSSSSDCSTPQRTSSTSSQSSTASIPARPIRPPPIETRTKASKPEQVFGATSLRDALNASTSRADNAGADSERVLTRGTGSGLGTAIAGRGKPPGFVVHGGRRGSGGAAVGTAPGGKKIVTGQAPIGRSSFKFGEELGRGSFSVVLKATHLATSQPYAVKILDKHHLRTHKKEKYATVEVEALKRLTASPPSASQPPTPTTPRATPTTPTFPPRSMSNSMSDSTIRASPTKPRAGSGADATEDRIKDVEKGKERAKGGHPGVVKLYWAFQDESSLYFALDLAPNGEILSLIRKLGSLSIPSARHYTAELVDVVAWMHSRGVLHRDLKPENILLDADMHIKLTDFGSAKVFPIVGGKVSRSGHPPAATGEGDAPATPKPSFVGTAEYVSPEVLLNDPTTESSDFWAIGCILFQLIAGVPPFRGRTEYLTFQKIKALEFTFPEGFDPLAKDLVEQLLVLDPTQRLGASTSIAAIKAHPFFAPVTFSSLFLIPVPPRESGLVGPPEPIRTDFFSGLGLGVAQSDGHDGSDEDEDDGIHSLDEDNAPSRDHAEQDDDGSDFDEEERFEPPRNRWGGRGGHGHAGGSVSSGSTMGSSDVTTTPVNGTGFGGGRPWSSVLTDASGSSVGSGRTTIGAAGLGVGEDEGGPRMADRMVSGGSQAWMSPGPWASPAAKGGGESTSLPLLPDESVVFTSSILLPSSTHTFSKSLHLPTKPRERRLFLTDFPRILCVKHDSKTTGALKVKSECLILRRGTSSSTRTGAMVAGGGNVMKSVKEKGTKGFAVVSSQTTYVYLCEDEHLRARWVEELKRIQE